MLKKKRSFVTYTIVFTALLITVGISCLLYIQNSLMKDDMELMAYEQLTQEVRQIRRYLAYDKDGNPYISEGFYNREEESDTDEEIWVFLQSKDGDIIYGAAPDGYADNPDVSGKSVLHMDVGNEKYFAVIRQGRSDKEELKKTSSYKICVMVPVSNLRYNYRDLLYKSYSVIAAVAIVFVIFALVLKRLIVVPVGKINSSIEKSVDNLDFTENIVYNGPFRELDMLVDANNNLYKRVQQELERQSEFNANVSHELRTPVAVMHAQCQLSREIAEKNNDSEMLESIEVFERQNSRMKGLIEQMLQMATLDRDNVTVDMEEVDLLDVVESVCDDAEYICKKNLKFVYDLRSTIVRANMNHVVIVVNNLVSNAVKYSNDGGTIEVACGEWKGNYFISVRDEGRGMGKATKERIFESFYRGESDRSTEGFGLGLSQVMMIVRYYGGTVDVDSQPGKGSLFRVLIPMNSSCQL